MKKMFLLLLAFASMSFCATKAQILTVINETGGRLGFIALNKPFTRSDASKLTLYWISAGEKQTIFTDARLLGWHRPGFASGYTVIQKSDDTIAFVEHNNTIKSIHGSLVNHKLQNSFDEAYTFQTKNPHHKEQDCTECAENCYRRDNTVAYCVCLNWCWDHTLDRAWYLFPGDVINVLVARGTKIGVYENDNVGRFSCRDGECETISRTTIKRYY